ncbi:unnamed protein product [Rotaria magnacalcarata]|uniref:Diacylglycerol kinase accessory domain-containing protein n=1 Tax=Rotaria magnacalcarata TaxID=392030 RepID=A0A816TCN6_9BILA|nr:unnamed protein product [Rotaria magnacalcarata]CAF2119423.1 unnamed protein product [Rotaria magnacalcarata]CAF3798771.1 unnamed protein product [Rotaria magnacalcarata]CAF3856781.1 unnamed protein product [Rotaria magnacalcarata]
MSFFIIKLPRNHGIPGLPKSHGNPESSFLPCLSHILFWGNHYEETHILSSLIPIDCWQVDIEQLNISILTAPTQEHDKATYKLNPPKFGSKSDRGSYQNNRALPSTYFINYMSFRLDAAVAIEFYNERMHDPFKFSSSLKNKLIYLTKS